MDGAQFHGTVSRRRVAIFPAPERTQMLHRRPICAARFARHFCAPKRTAFQPRPVPDEPPALEIAAKLLGPLPCPHDDKHVLCLNKPSGVLSQPDSSGMYTAAEAANAYYHETNIEAVHRLDKLATGCLLLGRTSRAKKRLAAQFAESSVIKNYLAVVTGRVLRPGDTSLVVCAMRRDWRGRVVVSPPWMGSGGGGLPQAGSAAPSAADARSAGSGSGGRGGGGRRDRGQPRTTLLRWRVLATHANASLLVVSPRGGFKHQVRAMLAYDGLPIVGDPLYGGERWEHEEPFLALHAATLALAHPIAGSGPLRLCAGVPRDDWLRQLPPPLVRAAEAAVAQAEATALRTRLQGAEAAVAQAAEASDNDGEESPLWARPPEEDEADEATHGEMSPGVSPWPPPLNGDGHGHQAQDGRQARQRHQAWDGHQSWHVAPRGGEAGGWEWPPEVQHEVHTTARRRRKTTSRRRRSGSS